MQIIQGAYTGLASYIARKERLKSKIEDEEEKKNIGRGGSPIR